MVRLARSASGKRSQLAFYAARLRATEQTLLEVCAQAERLASDLVLLCESAEVHTQGAEHVMGMLGLQADAITKLAETHPLSENLRCNRSTRDAARRVWKERSILPEARRLLDARLLEIFQQQALRTGASIPDTPTG